MDEIREVTSLGKVIFVVLVALLLQYSRVITDFLSNLLNVQDIENVLKIEDHFLVLFHELSSL